MDVTHQFRASTPRLEPRSSGPESDTLTTRLNKNINNFSAELLLRIKLYSDFFSPCYRFKNCTCCDGDGSWEYYPVTCQFNSTATYPSTFAIFQMITCDCTPCPGLPSCTSFWITEINQSELPRFSGSFLNAKIKYGARCLRVFESWLSIVRLMSIATKTHRTIIRPALGLKNMSR